MKLSEAQKLYIQHVRRDYSSWSTYELKQEYNRIGQELFLRDRPDSPPAGYPYPNRMMFDDGLGNAYSAVDRLFDRRVPIQHAIWREERNLP